MSQNWTDLRPRVIWGVIMAVVGFGALLWSGPAFQVLTCLLCGVVLWEICTMARPGPVWPAVIGGAGSLVLAYVYFVAWDSGVDGMTLALAVPLAVACAVWARRSPIAVGLSALWVVIAALVLGVLHRLLGMGAVAIVLWAVVTDVAGYFAGRLIGGRKFWPSISPNKTWAGIVAGWLAAAVVAQFFELGWEAALFGILLSFSSQMGDIAQSALKRRLGAKDSSSLIPGHGGVFDRVDGILGASIAGAVMLFVALSMTPSW